MSIGTLLQYARALRAQALRDYPGLRASEYDACYPPESRLRDWTAEVLAAARRGEVLSRFVLDDLYRRGQRGVYREIQRCYRAALPPGYLWPEVRQVNQAIAAENRAARQRGRAAARRSAR